MTTYCDVNTCEDCPRYGDDCDGDKRVEHTDLISRADALEQMAQAECGLHYDDCEADNCSCSYIQRILGIPSADAVSREEYNKLLRNKISFANATIPMFTESEEAKPTVIRSKTLLPTKDFKEWAKRIRETNPNAVVIPCDAEVVSADAVQWWMPCSERLPSESGEYLATIPLDADETYTEVLTFHKGRFYEDDDEWGATYHDDVLAWMPLPKPYREVE